MDESRAEWLLEGYGSAAAEPLDGTRDPNARRREPGGGLKVGAEEVLSGDLSEFCVVDEGIPGGEIPGMTREWNSRDPPKD